MGLATTVGLMGLMGMTMKHVFGMGGGHAGSAHPAGCSPGMEVSGVIPQQIGLVIETMGGGAAVGKWSQGDTRPDRWVPSGGGLTGGHVGGACRSAVEARTQ
jgi:hypothetical protein